MKKTVKTIELIWEERTTASGNRSHSSVVVHESPKSDRGKGPPEDAFERGSDDAAGTDGAAKEDQ